MEGRKKKSEIEGSGEAGLLLMGPVCFYLCFDRDER